MIDEYRSVDHWSYTPTSTGHTDYGVVETAGEVKLHCTCIVVMGDYSD